MSDSTVPIVLGSRSPRRRELLALLVDPHRIVVRPPHDPAEASLDDVKDIATLHARLLDIAQQKNADVVRQLQSEAVLSAAAVLTADTVIVGLPGNGISTAAVGDGGPIVVLGQPPQQGDWRATVRDWFERYYLGRAHLAVTAVCLTTGDQRRCEQVVTTDVWFRAEAGGWLDWYLATEEPIGKAGGYGLQGAGSLFVERVDGSPSNVIGLPLCETAQMLRSLGLQDRART